MNLLTDSLDHIRTTLKLIENGRDIWFDRALPAIMKADTILLETDGEIDDDRCSAIAHFAGDGNVHRYYIRQDGEIVFSHFHAESGGKGEGYQIAMILCDSLGVTVDVPKGER
jgi:hypothetical protein